MNITRRSFVKTVLGATAVSLTPALAARACFGQSSAPVREFRLSASRARVRLGEGPAFWAWTYNGQVPGPEIRVKEGETVRVSLKNFLPEETSIHWHGVPVPNPMDGVPGVTQSGVRPGETFLYEFEARPPGTYIYHSHAGYQLDQGLYGPLIIEPASGNGSHDREYTLMLEDWVMKDEGGRAETRRRSPMGMMGGMMGMRGGFGRAGAPLLEPFYDGYAVNGRLYPHLEPLEVRKGERVKLRLLNPSSATIYDLQLAGHAMTITHTDGRPVAPLETDILRIGMGERYDVEFEADNPGSWLLSAKETGLGEGQLRVPVRYRGSRAAEPAPPDFHSGRRFAAWWGLRSVEPTASSRAEAPGRFLSQALSGGMHSPYWTINGQVFPEVAPIRVAQGELLRLGYRNHSMMPHPMHLHGHFFRVVHPALPRDRWIQKDTVIVDPMQRVEIEFVADNLGAWFHHCHNLYHMNAGMANVVTVEA